MRNFVSLFALVLFALPASASCPWTELLPKARLPRPTVTEKAKALATDPTLSLVLTEIGAAQKVADSLLEANPGLNLISLSPYDRAASDARYGRAGDSYDPANYINEARLARQLEVEWQALKPAPGTQPLVLADTASTNRNSGEAWIGIRTRFGSDPIEVRLHVRLFEGRTALQKETLGKIGINLAYAARHYVRNPGEFLASLLDGIPQYAATIDYAWASAVLGTLRGGWPLLEAGLTPYLLFSPKGEPTGVSHPAFIKFAAKGSLPKLGQWTLVQEYDSAGLVRKIWEGALRAPPRPERPPPLPEVPEPGLGIVEWKAKRLSLDEDLKGSLIQIGGGARIASRYFEAPYGRTLYQTVYYGDARTAVGRYGEGVATGDGFSRVSQALETEYAHVTYHRPHRKFVLTTLVEANRAYVGVQGQLKLDAPPVRLLVEFDLKETDPGRIREAVGALGISTLYGFIHSSVKREVFLQHLADGLEPGAFEAIRVQTSDREGNPISLFND